MKWRKKLIILEILLEIKHRVLKDTFSDNEKMIEETNKKNVDD